MTRRFVMMLAAALGMLSCSQPRPATLWFAVAESASTVTQAMRTAQALRTAWPSITVIATVDCGNLTAGMYLAAVPARDQTDAQSMSERLSGERKDANAQPCQARPDTRLELGVPLLDPSMAAAPSVTVNWTDADRMSSVHKIAGGGYLWIRRQYVAAPEDPREGRRASVWYFAKSPDAAKLIEADCTDVAFASQAVWLALSCARETAAEQLLHSTMVYRIGAPGVKHTYPRCRAPRFESDTELTCQEEAVSNQGELKLTPMRVRLN